MIHNPTLPPKLGYVEVETDGVRKYRNVKTGVLLENENTTVPAPSPDANESVWDELDAAYKEGVNSAYDE